MLIIFQIVETENEYEIEEISESKPRTESKNVVVVSLIDLCEPKNKNAILVQPNINPYYEGKYSESIADTKPEDPSSNIERITVVKNIYYT